MAKAKAKTKPAGTSPATPPAPVTQPAIVPVVPPRRSSRVTNLIMSILAIAVLVLTGVLIYIGKKTPEEKKAPVVASEAERLKVIIEEERAKIDKAEALKLKAEADKVTKERQGEEKPVPTRKVVGPKLPPPPEPLVTEEKTEDRVEEENLVRTMFNLNGSVADRLNATESLGNYRYYRVARALSFVLQRDTVPSLRAMAATSMGEVANSSFADLLEHSAAKDPDEKVRAEAKKALEKINARVAADKDF